ncbi:unnamed protein product [Candidula unifasciata]|uniref:EGF-like domain-containing protein n=1 Tax=Candidula unifasciata TaxID=100452 RepID=A0A8S3ZLE3_9EUPU|nr:unnamed protein product [Candidula unifasciata]
MCCADCPDKMFGPTCENTCSRRCVRQVCQTDTGKCLTCREGYSGDRCEQGGEKYWMAYVLGVFVVLLIIVYGLCYFIDTKRKRKPPPVTPPSSPPQKAEVISASSVAAGSSNTLESTSTYSDQS